MYPKWSYPNYKPTYKRLTKSPAPPSMLEVLEVEDMPTHAARIAIELEAERPKHLWSSRSKP